MFAECKQLMGFLDCFNRKISDIMNEFHQDLEQTENTMEDSVGKDLENSHLLCRTAKLRWRKKVYKQNPSFNYLLFKTRQRRISKIL